MKAELKKAFEDALKFKKCQEVNSDDEFCNQYVTEDENCGICPYFVKDIDGYEAEEKVLNYALGLYEEGKLQTI